MPDRIVEVDESEWRYAGGHNKGQTIYLHLMDGRTREIDIRDYGHTDPVNFRITIRNAARKLKLRSRGMVLNDHTVRFQVLGKEEGS